MTLPNKARGHLRRPHTLEVLLGAFSWVVINIGFGLIAFWASTWAMADSDGAVSGGLVAWQVIVLAALALGSVVMILAHILSDGARAVRTYALFWVASVVITWGFLSTMLNGAARGEAMLLVMMISFIYAGATLIWDLFQLSLIDRWLREDESTLRLLADACQCSSEA